MKRFSNYMLKTIFICFLSITYLSCIKQSSEECPTTFRGIITIKDKNYTNAASIPSFPIRDEQAPFNEFVQQISYELLQTDTKKIINSLSNFTIPDNEQTHVVNFPTLTPGQYVFRLQGNIPLPTTTKDDSPSIYALHPSSQEGEDIYLFKDTIYFSNNSSEAVFPLTRTKGALFVQIDNLPDTVTKIQGTIEHIYSNVDENASYSGETVVTKTFTTNIHPTTTLLTLLAPTVIGKQSILRLAFYGSNGDIPYMFIPDIPLTILRNEVTAFKFSFIPEGGIEVWIVNNGVWNKSHDLDVTL